MGLFLCIRFSGCVFFASAQMGLYFNVQLCVDLPQPEADEFTVISLPCLGNAEIRRRMTPLMTLTDEGYVPGHGQLPINVGTPAYDRLAELTNEVKARSQELAEYLEKQGDDDWSTAYDQYVANNNWRDLLIGSIHAIEQAQQNPAISCRIVWG